jgi:hypothetical protein
LTPPPSSPRPALQREDLCKAGGPKLLAAALDCDVAATRHPAMGALASVAAADAGRWLPELGAGGGDGTGQAGLAGRLIVAAAAAAVGPHERTRVEAVALLAAFARAPELAGHVWGHGGRGMMAALQRGGAAAADTPSWAGQRRLQAAAALGLQALLEPSQWEPETVRQARRSAVLQSVGLAQLLALIAGDASAGCPMELRVAAAACLRFTALDPEAPRLAAGVLFWQVACGHVEGREREPLLHHRLSPIPLAT